MILTKDGHMVGRQRRAQLEQIVNTRHPDAQPLRCFDSASESRAMNSGHYAFLTTKPDPPLAAFAKNRFVQASW